MLTSMAHMHAKTPATQNCLATHASSCHHRCTENEMHESSIIMAIIRKPKDPVSLCYSDFKLELNITGDVGMEGEPFFNIEGDWKLQDKRQKLRVRLNIINECHFSCSGNICPLIVTITQGSHTGVYVLSLEVRNKLPLCALSPVLMCFLYLGHAACTSVPFPDLAAIL